MTIGQFIDALLAESEKAQLHLETIRFNEFSMSITWIRGDLQFERSFDPASIESCLANIPSMEVARVKDAFDERTHGTRRFFGRV